MTTPKMQILIVEDDKDMLKMLAEIFQLYLKHPVNILTANNGEDAYAKCESNFFDLIVTDINMPKMDGIQFINKIVPTKDKMYRKIYVHSGRLANETKEVVDVVDRYFTKGDNNPLDIIELIRSDFNLVLSLK